MVEDLTAPSMLLIACHLCHLLHVPSCARTPPFQLRLSEKCGPPAEHNAAVQNTVVQFVKRVVRHYGAASRWGYIARTHRRGGPGWFRATGHRTISRNATNCILYTFAEIPYIL